MLILNTANSLLGARIGAVIPTGAMGNTQGPQSLKDVIEKLAQTLMPSGGHLDRSSPLGNIVGKQMEKMFPIAILGGGSQDMVKAALGEVIKEKLGDNFGAAADQGLGAGFGQRDLMSQVLNGLGKSLLDDLLGKQGEGAKFSSGDMPLLEKIAHFMDHNPSKFPVPDSGSWNNELKEDNYLDGKETGAFRAALDVLGSQMGQQQHALGSGDWGLGLPPGSSSLVANPEDGQGGPSFGNVTQDLGQLVGNLLQRGISASLGGGLGTPINEAMQPANGYGNNNNQNLGALLGGLIEKGLEASLVDGSGGSGAGMHPHSHFALQDLQCSAAQAASSIVAALLGVGSNGLS